MLEEDVIDGLVGKRLHLRTRRPITVEQAQKSYNALFLEDKDFPLKDRLAIATFVSRLHEFENSIVFYDQQLKKLIPEWSQIIEKAAEEAKSTGPFGRYPDGPLTKENAVGKTWTAGAELEKQLGKRLAAALSHSHLLVFHPRDCEANDLQLLKKAEWNNQTIVTLSQLVAFLSFQIRLSIGLRLLASSQKSS